MTSPFQQAWDDERCAWRQAYKAHWTRVRAERRLWKLDDTRAARHAHDRLYRAEMDAADAHDLAKERLAMAWHTCSRQLVPYRILTYADACLRETSVADADAVVGALIRDGVIDDSHDYYRQGLVDVRKLVSQVLQKAQSKSVRVGSNDV